MVAGSIWSSSRSSADPHCTHDLPSKYFLRRAATHSRAYSRCFSRSLYTTSLRERDSNPRPPGYEPGVLTELHYPAMSRLVRPVRPAFTEHRPGTRTRTSSPCSQSRRADPYAIPGEETTVRHDRHLASLLTRASPCPSLAVLTLSLPASDTQRNQHVTGVTLVEGLRRPSRQPTSRSPAGRTGCLRLWRSQPSTRRPVPESHRHHFRTCTP